MLVAKPSKQVDNLANLSRLCLLEVSRGFEMDDEDDLQPDSPPGFVEEIDSSELEITEVTL